MIALVALACTATGVIALLALTSSLERRTSSSARAANAALVSMQIDETTPHAGEEQAKPRCECEERDARECEKAITPFP